MPSNSTSQTWIAARSVSFSVQMSSTFATSIKTWRWVPWCLAKRGDIQSLKSLTSSTVDYLLHSRSIHRKIWSRCRSTNWVPLETWTILIESWNASIPCAWNWKIRRGQATNSLIALYKIRKKSPNAKIITPGSASAFTGRVTFPRLTLSFANISRWWPCFTSCTRSYSTRATWSSCQYTSAKNSTWSCSMRLGTGK